MQMIKWVYWWKNQRFLIVSQVLFITICAAEADLELLNRMSRRKTKTGLRYKSG